MRNPNWIKAFLILPLYPILYLGWVNQIKNSWIQNDIKDLHPQILFPQQDRYKWKHVQYDFDQQFKDCVKFDKKGLREEYVKRIELKSQKINKN